MFYLNYLPRVWAVLPAAVVRGGQDGGQGGVPGDPRHPPQAPDLHPVRGEVQAPVCTGARLQVPYTDLVVVLPSKFVLSTLII